MKIFKRPLLYLIVFSLFCFVLPVPIHAVTLSPNSGSVTANGSSTITLYANPQGSETMVKLELNFVNAKVTDFTANTTVFTLGAMPECTNGENFTDNMVCATLTSTQTIPSGAVIGTVKVTWGSPGTATVTAGTGNLYRSSSDRIDSGLKATYSITGSSVPGTAFVTIKDEYVFILIGLSLISFGIYLNRQAKKDENHF